MATAPNKWERWTDAEDSVVDLFPVAEAAAILGRTYEGVRSRRAIRGLGPAHGNRKPKKRLRREYFSTGEGPREETVPLPDRKCRYCPRTKLHARGLCSRCYRWVQRMVESGYVTWEIAERCWLSARAESTKTSESRIAFGSQICAAIGEQQNYTLPSEAKTPRKHATN